MYTVTHRNKTLVMLFLLTDVFTFYAPFTFSAQPQTPALPYINLGSTDGVEREYVGHFDDGVSHAINIPDGFPFGNMIHTFAYVRHYCS